MAIPLDDATTVAASFDCRVRGQEQLPVAFTADQGRVADSSTGYETIDYSDLYWDTFPYNGESLSCADVAGFSHYGDWPGVPRGHGDSVLKPDHQQSQEARAEADLMANAAYAGTVDHMLPVGTTCRGSPTWGLGQYHGDFLCGPSVEWSGDACCAISQFDLQKTYLMP